MRRPRRDVIRAEDGVSSAVGAGACVRRMDFCLRVEEFVRRDLLGETVAVWETAFRKLVAK